MDVNRVANAVARLLEKMYVSDLQDIAVNSHGNRKDDSRYAEYAKEAIRANAKEFTDATGIELDLDFLNKHYWKA